MGSVWRGVAARGGAALAGAASAALVARLRRSASAWANRAVVGGTWPNGHGPQILAGADDMLDGDGGVAGSGGVVERLEREVVGGAQVPRPISNRASSVRSSNGTRAAPATAQRWATYWASSSRDRQAELRVVDDAPGHRFLVVAREQRAQRALPGDDEGEHEAAVHVEVGEDAEHAQDVWVQLVTLVEEEHGSSALVVRSALEALLQATDEHRVGAGGLSAAGDGDLAAHVALGQAGDLDVVDVVARLRQGAAQATEQRGLAGAGRGDERGGHARLDGGTTCPRTPRRGTASGGDRRWRSRG